MRLFNADGGRAEVSGNGVRALAALLLHASEPVNSSVTIETEGGVKQAVRLDRAGSRQTFRTAMGLPSGLRQVTLETSGAGGETVDAVVMNFGNPQCILLGPLPDEDRFRRVGECARTARAVSRPDQRRVRRRGTAGPDPDSHLGAGGRSDDVVGHRVVCLARGRRGFRRRCPRRHGGRSRRLSARRVAGRGGLPHRLGRGDLRRGVAPRLSWHFLPAAIT